MKIVKDVKDITLILSQAGALSINEEGYTDVDMIKMFGMYLAFFDAADWHACKYILNFLDGMLKEIVNDNPGIQRLP